jgi:DNA-binding transcriptional LysR family regulator
MKISQLRCLLAVAEAGTVRQASRNLNLSQSSVTKSIQQLEADLQVELFHRGTHGLSPTDAGRMLISRAKTIMGELRQVRNDVETIREGTTGEIRISASPSVGMGLLPKAIANFRKKRPGVHFFIEEGSYPDFLPAVRSGDLDFAVALLPEPLKEDDLQQELLLQDNLVPAVRSEHPLAGKRNLSIADLVDQQWLVYSRSRTLRNVFAHTFVENGLSPPDGVIECTSFATTLALLEYTDMIALVPCQIFGDRQWRRPITPLFISSPMPSWDVTVVARPHHQLSRLCLAFLKELRLVADQSRTSAG